jgi:hypothetical protein
MWDSGDGDDSISVMSSVGLSRIEENQDEALDYAPVPHTIEPAKTAATPPKHRIPRVMTLPGTQVLRTRVYGEKGVAIITTNPKYRGKNMHIWKFLSLLPDRPDVNEEAEWSDEDWLDKYNKKLPVKKKKEGHQILSVRSTCIMRRLGYHRQ